MEVSEAKLLKALEVENARLKKLLAEQALDAGALRAWIIAATGSTQGRMRASRFRRLPTVPLGIVKPSGSS